VRWDRPYYHLVTLYLLGAFAHRVSICAFGQNMIRLRLGEGGFGHDIAEHPSNPLGLLVDRFDTGFRML
jgi:hypothetical protein